jgi:hypothetical protein
MGYRHGPVHPDDLAGQVSDRWLGGLSNGISAAERQMLVDSWLADIQRRGAKIHSVSRINGVLSLSLQGKARFRYSVWIDIDDQHIIIELDRPEWKWAKRERYPLRAGNLRLLAKRICPLPEGQAMVSLDLLVRLSQLCGAYRQLLPETDRNEHSQFPPTTISKLESELRNYLIPDGHRLANGPDDSSLG